MKNAPQIRCPRAAEELTVLVHPDHADLYMKQLAERFPQVRFEVLPELDGLQERLEHTRPDCVLSFRMPAKGPFPRETLLTYPTIRWLHATGAGIEHLPPWDAGKLMVTNSSGLHVDVMAEYAAWAVLHLEADQTLTMDRLPEAVAWPISSSSSRP